MRPKVSPIATCRFVFYRFRLLLTQVAQVGRRCQMVALLGSVFPDPLKLFICVSFLCVALSLLPVQLTISISSFA
jgi:hypothetical protein